MLDDGEGLITNAMLEILFSKVIAIAGQPDESLNLGESTLYRYVSEEWKGFLRGGTIVRRMEFVVKDGKTLSKTSQNLDRIAG